MNSSRQLLDELAMPRLVGSPDHTRIRDVLRRELVQRGYKVLEHPFPVVPPGRLAGAMYVGAGVLGVAVGVLVRGAGTRVIAVASFAAALTVLASVLRARAGRALPPLAGLNLIGVRPKQRVTVWLAAHYDSKGQPLSMLLRLIAVALAVVGALGLVTVAVSHIGGAGLSRAAELLCAAPALGGGLLLLQNRATNSSPGAVDNATALTAVFAILDRLPADAPVGVVFPDAEEYGLLGATALARERSNLFEGTAVVNLDGIDDRGAALCLMHRAGPTVDAVAAALHARPRRFVPVVVDGLALAPVTRECATIMRGDWRTAAVVHTRRDTGARLSLEGVREVAEAIATVLGKAR